MVVCLKIGFLWVEWRKARRVVLRAPVLTQPLALVLVRMVDEKARGWVEEWVDVTVTLVMMMGVEKVAVLGLLLVVERRLLMTMVRKRGEQWAISRGDTKADYLRVDLRVGY